MIIYITQKSYYLVLKNFIRFFVNSNTEVIYVKETKKSFLEKLNEIIVVFGFINFIKLALLEISHFIFLISKTKNINSLKIEDINLNIFLENLIKKKDVDKIISIGCPCKININLFKKYNIDVLNLHGGIIPYQKGKYSPIKSMMLGHTHIGASLHHMSDKFDSGEIISQNYFKIVSKNKLKNYNIVLNKSSDLLGDYLNDKISTISNEAKISIFEKFK